MQAFYDVVIYFTLFSVCGWICESAFCSINERRPVNRGFLNGPVCPVYGFGGLAVVYILAPLRHNIPLLFLFGMLAATVLEYITSFVMEKLFHTRWWDYSENRFNLNGRVCLAFSLMFGGLSVVAVRLLYPPFSMMVSRITLMWKPWLAWGMLALFAADCAFTVISVLRLGGRLAEMEAVMREIRQKLEEVSERGALGVSEMLEHYSRNATHERYESVRASVENARERMRVLLSRRRISHSRLLRAFPRMKSLKYKDQLIKLRETLDKKISNEGNVKKGIDNE